MFSRDKSLSTDGGHPAHEVLLRFLDGLLAPAEARSVQTHLDVCWECRRQCARFQDAIDAYFDFQECAYSDEIQPPPRNWAGFQFRLNQLERKLQSATPHESPLHKLRRLLDGVEVATRWVTVRRSAMTAGLLTAAVIAVTLLVPAPQPVSAMVLLKRASLDEHAEIEQPGKVLHRVVNVEQRVAATGKLVARRRVEIWQSGSKKAAHRVYDAKGALVAGEWIHPDGSHVVFQNAKIRSAPSKPQLGLTDDAIWRFAPSAETFAGVAGHLDKVTVEERPGVYVLQYENSQTGNLRQASLTLRRSDLHAIEQTLRVEQGGEAEVYHFVEAAFERKPVSDVAANVFALDPGLVTRPVPTEVAHPEPEPTFAHGTADLEVSVLNLLDQVDALVRNQVTVRRAAPGTLLIQGLVDTDERKQEIAGALAPLAPSSTVQVDIHTAAEAEEQQLMAPSTRLHVQEVEVAADAQDGNPDIRRYLAQTPTVHRSGKQVEDEVNRFSYSVYNHLAEAQLEASALRQIVESLSVAEFNSMTPKSRRQWQALVRKHAERTQHEMRAVRESLAPIFHPAAVESTLPVPTDIREQVILISRLAAAADNVIWQALASSSEESSARLRSPQVWESLEQVEQLTKVILNEVQP